MKLICEASAATGACPASATQLHQAYLLEHRQQHQEHLQQDGNISIDQGISRHHRIRADDDIVGDHSWSAISSYSRSAISTSWSGISSIIASIINSEALHRGHHW